MPIENGSNTMRGCLSNLQLSPWGFKAFVMKDTYIEPTPVITKFLPGHDRRMVSTSSIPVELHFSVPMDCQQISDTLNISSTTVNNQTARLNKDSVRCGRFNDFRIAESSPDGIITSSWFFSASMVDVSDGIHQITLNNISTAANKSITTRSTDHFLLRIGNVENPMVFSAANYSSNLLYEGPGRSLYIMHKAAGADSFRYSLNFGTTYSSWKQYPTGANPVTVLAPRVWSGTESQAWKGSNVIVQYWSRLASSSDHVQQADLNSGGKQRHFPHAFLEGTFNQHGFDSGFQNEMQMTDNNTWTFDFAHEWPAQVAVNLWGINSE